MEMVDTPYLALMFILQALVLILTFPQESHPLDMDMGICGI